MNKRINLTVVIAAVGLAAFADDSNKPGVWIAGSVSGALNESKTLKVSAAQESRFDSKRLIEEHTQASLLFSPVDWFDIGPHVHWIDARAKKSDGGHEWNNELRLGIESNLKYKFEGWNFANRNRFVWREFEKGNVDFFRWRSRFQVIAPDILEPVGLKTDWKVKPFASYEFFFDNGKPSKHVRTNDKFDQQWLRAGLKFAFSEHWGLDVFYHLQIKKSSSTHDWDPGHVIGLNFGYKF